MTESIEHTTDSGSHLQCQAAGFHVCREPSGRVCIEQGCNRDAGTLWGPHWCPQHDQKRLDRISRNFDELAKHLQERA